MKRPVPTATRASRAVRQVAARPVRPSKIANIGRNDRAARAAVGDGTQAASAGRVYDQTREQVRGAAMPISRSIEQRPILALLVTGTIGFLMGFLSPRH
jgi:hypothetical protein